MKQLKIKKADISDFGVDSVVDFEGCPSALKYLTQKYGQKRKNLVDCKDEILSLIEDDKEDWVINFLLNLLRPKYRLQFYTSLVETSLESFKDEDFSQLCLSYLKSPQKYEEVLSATDELIVLNDSSSEYKRLVLQSIYFLSQDGDKKYTRSITDGLMKLAEANVHLDVVKYNYQDNIRKIAHDLMDVVGLWK